MNSDIILINVTLIKSKETKKSFTKVNYCYPKFEKSNFMAGQLMFESWLEGDYLNLFTENNFGKVLKATIDYVPNNNGCVSMKLRSINGIF